MTAERMRKDQVSRKGQTCLVNARGETEGRMLAKKKGISC